MQYAEISRKLDRVKEEKEKIPPREVQTDAGNPTLIFISVEKMKEKQKAIVVTRLSSLNQFKNQNHKHQEKVILVALKKKKAKVISKFAKIVNAGDPSWLLPIAEKGIEENAVLVFLSTDRAIRHPRAHKEGNYNLLPREEDLELLRKCTLGIPLYVVIPPDTPMKEIRNKNKERGLKYNTSKKTQRINWKQKVQEIGRTVSSRKIAQMINNLGGNISYRTICRWLKEEDPPYKSVTN